MPFGSRIGPALTIAVCAFAMFAARLAVADALPIGQAALPGGRHVGSAQTGAPLAATVGVGYGHTERVAGSRAVHERALGEVAASYSPFPALFFGATGIARFDAHRAQGKRQDEGAAFGSSLSGRLRHSLSRDLTVAADLTVLFPPANGASRGLKATSPVLKAIGTYALPRRSHLSLNAGARLDRSRFAVDEPEQLSTNDRVGANLSESNAILLGVLGSREVAGLVLTGEWSWDLAVGRAAPSAWASPMRVELGAQRRLVSGLFAGALVGVSPSSRPKVNELARIEPRVWALLTIGVLFDPAQGNEAHTQPETASEEPAPEAQAPPAPTESVKAGPALPPGQIRGRVRSLRGKALKAQIEVLPLGQTMESDAKGAFVIDVPPGRYRVVVRAEGHETQERPAEVEQDGVTILVIDLRRSKP